MLSNILENVGNTAFSFFAKFTWCYMKTNKGGFYMNIIEIGMLVCIGMLIICSVCLKLTTDKIIEDDEREKQELRKRLVRWVNYSYEQNDKIKKLETLLKEGGK